MRISKLAFAGIVGICALIVGVLFGSVAERQGWVPHFTTSRPFYELVLARAKRISPDTLAMAQRSGIPVSSGDKTITVFTDLQCPYCKEFHTNVIPELEKGGIAVRYRHFPLPFHHQATVGARLVDCVNQTSNVAARILIDSLFTIAAEDDTTDFSILPTTGITYSDLEECGIQVDMDIADARLFGVKGTPSLIINGRLIGGTLPATTIIEILTKSNDNNQR